MRFRLWDTLRREYWFPLALALLIVILGTVPYLYGYRNAEPGEIFMGFVGRGTSGANGYLMMARQCAEGHHLIENFMTAENVKRNYFNLEWWLYGKCARWSGLSLIQTFHLFRVTGVFFLVGAVYFLVTVCFETRYFRRLALTLIVFASGFGWLIWGANKALGMSLPLPLDLSGVTIFGYLVNKPHFIRAGIFSALQFGFLLLAEKTGQRKYYVWSGIMAGGNTLIRPFHLPETYALYLIYPALRAFQEKRIDWSRIKGHALAATVQLPALIPHVYTALWKPLGLSVWARQTEFLLPMTLWLGLPFALVCIYFIIKGFGHLPEARPVPLMMGTWLFIAWLLVQSFPYFNWSHEGFFPFMYAPVILALSGPLPWLVETVQRYIRQPISWERPGLRFTAATLLVLACLPSSVYVYADFFVRLHHPQAPWRYYLSNDELAAIDWLGDHLSPGDTVLSMPETSQFIPRFRDVKVVIAHDILTADYQEKNWMVQRFFHSRYDDHFKRWAMEQLDAQYLLIGPCERFPHGLKPADHPWLEALFTRGQCTVYRVRNEF